MFYLNRITKTKIDKSDSSQIAVNIPSNPTFLNLASNNLTVAIVAKILAEFIGSREFTLISGNNDLFRCNKLLYHPDPAISLNCHLVTHFFTVF